MQAVLISIQPGWCELIASGKKTVEVRKTKPKLETPFKVYIYCTKNKEKLIEVIHEGDEVYGFIHEGKPNFIKMFDENWTIYGAFKGGKVIGEFVCDDIDTIAVFNDRLYCVNNSQANKLKQMCLTIEEIKSYLGSKNLGYNWHISDLKIYGKPRELEEFKKPCNHKNDCCTCDRYDYIGHRCYDKITRPPQSWCYVEREDAE